MSSDRKIAANRLNAKKSTGPRSSAGKARSRRNALKHGLTARQLLLPSESAADYEKLRASVFDRFEPVEKFEEELVDRVVNLLWRMRRVAVFETALVDWTNHLLAQEHDCFSSELDPGSLAMVGVDASDHGRRAVLEIGRAVESLVADDLIGKLSQYELGLQRQLGMAIKSLQLLQSARPHVLVEASSTIVPHLESAGGDLATAENLR